MNKSNIILIGGAPTTGKTTVAEQLSKHMNLPWISTDQIRTIQRSVADENHFSELFDMNEDGTDPNELVDLEYSRSEVIWLGVLAFIKRYHPWNGCIIEGTAILPSLVVRDLDLRGEIQAFFLVHTNVEQIVNIVFERSKLPYIKTKTEYQQKSKVQQIELFNKRIISETQSNGLQTIESHSDQTLANILKLLNY